MTITREKYIGVLIDAGLDTETANKSYDCYSERGPDYILFGFNWDSTPEGGLFWRGIYEKLKALK